MKGEDMMKGCNMMGGDMTHMTHMMSMMREKRSHAGDRVAALKVDFKITESKMPAWNKFADALLASANCPHVAEHLLGVTFLCMRPHNGSIGFIIRQAHEPLDPAPRPGEPFRYELGVMSVRIGAERHGRAPARKRAPRSIPGALSSRRLCFSSARLRGIAAGLG
jgi:hypothetical protein